MLGLFDIRSEQSQIREMAENSGASQVGSFDHLRHCSRNITHSRHLHHIVEDGLFVLNFAKLTTSVLGIAVGTEMMPLFDQEIERFAK